MRILILGGGLMGPAAAYNAMIDPDVLGVTVCDLSGEQLDSCRERLSGKPGANKVSYRALDLNDRAAAVSVMSDHDAIVAALPRAASLLAVPEALEAGTPLVDLTRIPDDTLAQMKEESVDSEGFIVLGCGLEPGLTEIVARYLAETMDHADELHIKCGGIPKHPAPPLSYKIVFGGRHLPLRDTDSHVVSDGILTTVPRYSGVESVTFEGVGECQAWHEGFMPWLLELDALKDISQGTQKTVRWPGYAEKVTALKEMGMLSMEPIEVDGVTVIPKHVLDAVNYEYVKMQPEDRDITTFRVEVSGVRDGETVHTRADMVDHFDETLGFTSMARTTAFTAAIVARMIARGDLKHPGTPFITPEQVISGPLFDRLISDLGSSDISFQITGV
ncbi:MAG: hypothetical protein HOH43_27165 [Candidatus Latescibacteria bacterium]|jgi:lysine 6-dehydrogenase|nr:hypothetical protein [Candidatus Latescibacterota bacterium]